MPANESGWDRHYRSAKSRIRYPDENLVRLLAACVPGPDGAAAMTAIDLGCGAGRHLRLLEDAGFGTIVGTEISMPALAQVDRGREAKLVLASTASLPFADSTVHVAVAWGSLHYNDKADLPKMIGEIRRVLKPGGRLLATLRTSRDTHLRTGTHRGDNTWSVDHPDISGSTVSFFDEEEARSAFRDFSSCRLGLSERTPVGSLTTIISHWLIEAVR